MTKEVRKEKCKMCTPGTVTFIYFDDLKEILGACNYCGYCCGDKQDKLKFTKGK